MADVDYSSSLSGYSDSSSESEPETRRKSKKSPSKKRKPRDKDGTSLHKALKAPRGTTYTPQALHDQIHNGDIELSPEYQRDVVWSDDKQSALIDSILRNYYIPPVIFAVSPHEEELRTCIDGKQRLTSIQKFMDGLIPFKDSNTGVKLWYKVPPTYKGKTKPKILPERLRKSFLNKQIVCVEYQDITGKQERDIFQRVQMGMALTANEKMQVSSSLRRTFVRDLLNTYFVDGSLGGNAMVWDTARSNDFRCISQAVHIIDTYANARKLTWPSASPITKWLDQPTDASDSLKATMQQTLQMLVQVVRKHNTSSGSSSPLFGTPLKLAPVEVIGIIFLVSEIKDTHTVERISSTIRSLRQTVRAEHVDVNNNSRVGKTIFDFIEQLPPKPSASSAKPVSTNGKRKRDDGGEADYMDVDPKKERRS